MEIFNTLQSMVSKQSGVPHHLITRETDFYDLKFDSLDIVEIVMSIETRFNIELEDNEYEQLRTMGQVVQLVEKKLTGL